MPKSYHIWYGQTSLNVLRLTSYRHHGFKMMMNASSLVPAFILFILLVASTTTIVVIFSSSIHSLRLTYQVDIAKVNEQLSNMQVRQAAFQNVYANQIQSLTKLVSFSLNATDEFITNFTDSVTDVTQTIHEDMANVQDLQQNQNSLLSVEFAGMFTILVILVSGYHLSQHLRHMNLPIVQRKIMAVLWMTSLYAREDTKRCLAHLLHVIANSMRTLLYVQ